MSTFSSIHSKEFLEEENRATKEEVRGSKFLVPFTRSNIKRCRCSLCPVQADSDCVQDKLQSSKKAMENVSSEEILSPEDVPGIYCATGEAVCSGLNFDRQCICNTCEVWKEYNLKDADPNNHFCQHGRSV